MTAFMRLLSFLGSGAWYVPVIAVVYWCVSPRKGARATILLGLSGMLNSLLKLLLHLPRPYWTNGSIKPYTSLTSFGMPSGHAQNSVVAYGLLASETARPPRRAALGIWAAAIAMMILIGISRIYLGVHSTDQVFAGWAIGAVILAVALMVEPYVVPWWIRRPLAFQFALALLVALVFLGLEALEVRHLHGFHYRPEWIRNIVRAGGKATPPTLEDGAASSGAVLGGLSGVSLLAHRGWFEPGGVPLWRVAARAVVGAVGAGVIYGAGLLVGTAWPVTFVVEALLGLWAAAGAPETFLLLGLAHRRAPRQEYDPAGHPAG